MGRVVLPFLLIMAVVLQNQSRWLNPRPLAGLEAVFRSPKWGWALVPEVGPGPRHKSEPCVSILH